MALDIVGQILRVLAFIFLYWILGFAPGYYLGIVIANRFFAKGNQLRMEKQNDTIEQALEHNKQWHPDDPRWSR